MIFHGRLSDRNHWCRRRRRYLIFSQFSIYCYQNAFASGALPRTPPGGVQLPHLANVGSHHCRGPHRIAGPRAPRPHDPPLTSGQAPPPLCSRSSRPEKQVAIDNHTTRFQQRLWRGWSQESHVVAVFTLEFLAYAIKDA